MAATALGVFVALADAPLAAAGVAGRCGLPPRSARALLDALAALRVLEREGVAYRLGAAAARSLTRKGDRSRRHVVLHDLWHQGLWARLEEALRRGGPLGDRSGDPFLSDPAILSGFFPNLAAAMVETGRGLASRLPEALALRGDERVLDLGGGAGQLAIALARRHPELRLVVLDLPPVARLAEAALREAGLGDRVSVQAGDFRCDSLDPGGGGFDVVLVARVLMGLPDAEARELLARAAGALAPGGRLAVVEFRREVAPGALLDLDMLLATGGAVRTRAELVALAREAGLECRERPLGRAMCLIEARRPR